MTKPVIEVENLSKAYQIGKIGSGTLSQDIDRFWQTKILGKEDPFLKIGETNERSSKGNSNIVWSLKDINFEINQGDAVGIIGKNGAGKSTLLKLLSRVTSPTTGEIKVKGRIASLLEVGTGFHPELSGRENIYLNGAILGMRKKEITRKLDEIIDFSGVERYVDTPVKRYSSGMYVRLAFAVAAHLESEILIVDEVLAVGDAEFQKKCLGKMGDISKGDGRTILFVSHNMAAVKSLCSKSIVLENGLTSFQGDVNEGIDYYLQKNQNVSLNGLYKNDSVVGSGIVSIALNDEKGNLRTEFGFDETIKIKFALKIEEKYSNNGSIGFRLVNQNEIVIFSSEYKFTEFASKGGFYEIEAIIPNKILVPNFFKLTFGMHVPNVTMIDYLDESISFEIVETGSEFHIYKGNYGCVNINCNWLKTNEHN
jgi:lipopolysaccharide transport system ATP-binding protein